MSVAIQLERLVQRFGALVSQRAFSDERLGSDWGERVYVLLYETFKRLFERAELRQMTPHLMKGSTVVDVGANVGYLSFFFGECVGEEGRVLAIEPDPVMSRLLERRVARSRQTNIEVLRFAIGSAEGRAMFYRNLANRADNRMHPDDAQVPHLATCEVPVRTLSSVLSEGSDARRVSFIKIDTQGSEVAVLEGVRRWLETAPRPPVLSVECWPYGLRKAGSSIDELFERLEELGYRVPEAERRRFQRDAGPDMYESVLFFPTARRAS